MSRKMNRKGVIDKESWCERYTILGTPFLAKDGRGIWDLQMHNSRPFSPRYSKVTQRGLVDGDFDLGSA